MNKDKVKNDWRSDLEKIGAYNLRLGGRLKQIATRNEIIYGRRGLFGKVQ
ncbi:MAG: hypothetical protein FWC61_02955 [Proteobacteria bacterium]|nr:hypothetical protein [Pseudomonadota bacterium]